MRTSLRNVAVTTAALALFAALPACGKSKAEQCNAFIDRANAAEGVVNGLELDKDDAAKLEADAAKIEAEAAGVRTVALKDATLVKYRDDYAKGLGDLAANVRQLAKLDADAKDPAKAGAVTAQSRKLSSDAEAIGQREDELVAGINSYCTGTP